MLNIYVVFIYLLLVEIRMDYLEEIIVVVCIFVFVVIIIGMVCIR